ncbi:MAG: Rid family hydrolase [Bacteroidales bacterium]
MSSFSCSYDTTRQINFNDRIVDLISKINNKPSNIVSFTFFGATNEERYFEELAIIKATLQTYFVTSPLVTYVAQPLQTADELAMEVTLLDKSEAAATVQFKQLHDVRYAVCESDANRFLMVEGVFGRSFSDSVAQQSAEVFSKIESILTAENIPIQNIVRQWNYIGRITEIAGQSQNYQAFNDARAHFYEKALWSDGYPAATGIGMCCNGVLVSLIALAPSSSAKIIPINNPLQIPAFAYSAEQLIGKSEMPKLTPKFERAKIVQTKSGTICFVSGTAAIRGEKSMTEVDATQQTQQTIENIERLISNENLNQHGIANAQLKVSALRIYLKHWEDFASIHQVVAAHWGNAPAVYLQADICREELLLEIEAIAT